MKTLTELDEESLRRRLRRLELSVTRRLDGLLQGQHLGLLPGPGSEWDTGREYEPGDDVRRIDWAVTARTTVPHVRDTTADRELETWVAIDASASMDFGTAAMEKRDLALAALAAIGFLTANGGNRLGAVLLNGPTVRRFPARGGREALLALLRAVLAVPRTETGMGTPDVADAIEQLHRCARRRGLAVIISDFLTSGPRPGGPNSNEPHHGEPHRGEAHRGEPAWAAPLRRLAARHQVLAIEVTDPRESELPDIGLVTLVDPETGRRQQLSTSDSLLRTRYAAAAAAQRAGIHTTLRQAGAHHLHLRTDRDWIRDIAHHVIYQRRLAGAGGRTGTRTGGGLR